MLLWVRSRWTSKRFFHLADYALLVLVAACGGVAASIDPPGKWGMLAAGFAFTCLNGGAKFRAKLLEDREKEEEKSKASSREEQRAREHEAIKAEYDSQVRRMVQSVLAYMHEHFFEGRDKDDKHKHRVTLFVCAAETGPDGCSKSLAIFARKGAHGDSQTRWLVADDDLDRCRGMAGRIWCLGSTDEHAVGDAWDDNDPVKQAAYAKATDLTVAEAMGLRVKSQYFFGTVVMVRGKKWGVLLIDSLINTTARV